MTNKIKWIDEENLNNSFINKGHFYSASKLHIEVCVTRINRFVSKQILEKFYNRPIRVRVRT